MFSYVAKSLLSKTLKTFLRKYLENIEFESISYGSNSSSNDASANANSGWGIRLSNVKLREGMELMKLPGKRKRKVRVKKRVKRRRKKKVQTKPKNSENLYKQKSAEESMNGTKKYPGKVRRSSSQGSLKDPVPGVAKPRINGANRHPVQSTNGTFTEQSMSIGSEYDYFSSAPSTPVQKRTVICAPLSLCSSSKHKEKIGVDTDTSLKEIPLLPFDDQENEIGSQKEVETVDSECEHIDSHPSMQLAPDSMFINNLNFQNADEDSDGEASDDSVIEVEEEHTVEDTMSLVVGAGGIIGTLNIRLVGKELHVTVEDAHLIIEALPMGTVKDESNVHTSSDEAKSHVRSDSTLSEVSVDSKPEVSRPVDNATFGEKIMKKSQLARYLSMIPHLFLRDCRVSFILPGEQDFHDDDSTTISVSDCTVFECGLDFLSVTSGDDFMDVLRLDNGIQIDDPRSAPLSLNSQTSKGQKQDTNMFLRKRIRTGKGPEGGMWLKIHPPNNAYKSLPRIRHDRHLWARQRFLNSSAGFFFRCSGLDLHARMLIETKDDMKDEIAAAWSSEYDDYTMDSMLFGVDYVDPISLTRHQIRERMKHEMIDDSDIYDEANKTRIHTDQNGIQQINFASNFHWIAQRTHRKNCPFSHLPLSECVWCWNVSISAGSTEQKSEMDGKMPLPGFVFCLSVSDAIEFNVDRSSLDAMGYAISLFKSGSNPHGSEIIEDDNETRRPPSSKESTKRGNSSTPQAECFPMTFQPDAIYLSEMHLSKVIFRVHAISERQQHDMGLQFRYWQLALKSLYLEEHQIISDDLLARDVICHVGQINCTDFVGICEKQMLAAGSKHEYHLPFTASEVLGITRPSIPDTYAVHCRLIMHSDTLMNKAESNASALYTGFVDLKTGSLDIDINKSLFNEMATSANDAMFIVFPKSETKELKTHVTMTKKTSDRPGSDPKWMFQVTTHGGHIKYFPLIEMTIPETVFKGKHGVNGLLFDTFFEGLGVKYGSFQQQVLSQQLTLTSLPETLRMHILIFLDDLAPLEQVLHIHSKKGASIFLRSHRINKMLSSLKETKKCEHAINEKGGRRKKLLKRLQRLDDDNLEHLLQTHYKISGSG